MLLTDNYNTYVTDVIKLVRSFVIKSLQTIDSINSFLTAGGDILSNNPNQWKYYRNLAGLPYVGATGYFNDPAITVYSIDTNTTIAFTPDMMATHPITLADFRRYSTAYNNLLALYPDQEMLIRGVLNPIPTQLAMAAKNYEIIGHDVTYLGEGEVSLIAAIQTWINNYVARWDVTAFAVSDTLYSAASLGILYLNLVPVIINLRFKNCKTNEAHEYHIWNYLAGYFNLNKFKGIIPYQQALFLYRNIEYITANAGKESILDFLNTGFAYPFGLQLFSHDIRQDIGDSLENLDAGNYTEIANHVKINMYPYGSSNQVTNTSKFFTPEQITTKLVDQALLNPQNVVHDTEALISKTLQTPVTEIPTGIIECNIIRTSAVNMVSVVSEKIHNWLYLVNHNFIQYKHILSIPSEGITELSITAADAAVLLMYATAKYYGDTPVTIPQPRVRDIMYQPPLLAAELKGLVEPINLQGSIQYGTHLKSWDRYNDVITAQTLPYNILSLHDFTSYITKVVNNKIQHSLLPALCTTSLAKGEVEYLIKAFYKNETCSFVQETTYSEFFTRLGIDVNKFSNPSLYDLIDIIFKAYIGLVEETNSLQQPYASMVEILKVISSYMLQFVKGPSTNNIEPIDWCFATVSVPDHAKEDSIVRVRAGVDNNFMVPIIKIVNHELLVLRDFASSPKLIVDTAKVSSFTVAGGCSVSHQKINLQTGIMSPMGAYPSLIPVPAAPLF